MSAIMRQKRKQNLTILRRLLLVVAICCVALGGGLPARAASLVTAIVSDPLTGVAIEGYDPVSYFTEPRPLLGAPDHAYVWGGVPWYFASAANRDVFMRNPEIYAPQFGGHCATSLGRGFVSDGRPMLYAISGAKLYFFYSVANREAFLDADVPPVAVAKANWTKLERQLTRGNQSVADAVGTSR